MEKNQFKCKELILAPGKRQIATNPDGTIVFKEHVGRVVPDADGANKLGMKTKYVSKGELDAMCRVHDLTPSQLAANIRNGVVEFDIISGKAGEKRSDGQGVYAADFAKPVLRGFYSDTIDKVIATETGKQKVNALFSITTEVPDVA